MLADLYQSVPYPSQSFQWSHPDRLAAVARAHGLSPADPAACRVLEIGCAGGGNLVPMASECPGSEFVGIDLAQGQVSEARAMARGVGATNVRIDVGDIRDSTLDGPFDFVIAHGVFSWVSDDVRAAILALCSRSLSDQGVAYISYNALPGWHGRGVLRDMLRFHVRGLSDPQEQIGQARALMDFLADHAPKKDSPWGTWLRGQRDGMRRRHDAFLFHDLLEPHNDAFLLEDFIARANVVGLNYLGEADCGHWTPETLQQSVVDELSRMGDTPEQLLQTVDLFRDRTFHMGLLTPAAPQPPRLETLQTIAVEPLLDGCDRNYAGNAAMAALVDRATAKGPRAVSLGTWPDGLTVSSLLGMCADQALALVCRNRGLPASVPVQPTSTAVVRWQLGERQTAVTNRRHEAVAVDGLDRLLLVAMDGTRNRDALVTCILGHVSAGTLTLDQGVAGSQADVRAAVEVAVSDKLTGYLVKALIA